MQKITVIDSKCGSGKTEYIIRYMNANQERPYLYIAPLKEIHDRIQGKGRYEGRGTVVPFETPEPKFGKKSEGIKRLLEAGVNIASTHQLFMILDDEALELARSRNYHLIIDEALEPVSVLKFGKQGEEVEDDTTKQLKQRIQKGDIPWLLEHNIVEIDPQYGDIRWIEEREKEIDDTRLDDLKHMIKIGALSRVEDNWLIWHFPIKAIEAFSDITVLTYRYQHSIMRAHLKSHGKHWTLKTVVWADGSPSLEDLTPDVLYGPEWAQYVNICEHQKLNAIGLRPHKQGAAYPLSFSWYDNNKGWGKPLGNNLYNYFRNINHAPSDAVMWTTYKKCKDKIKPNGYVQCSRINPVTGEAEKKSETFVACTCKATEQYKDKYVLAYLIDRHLNPGIKKYFQQYGVTIAEDEWALSELIQWVFRSRIRDDRAEDRSIYIYIPSERMRRLFKRWLNLSDKGVKRAA